MIPRKERRRYPRFKVKTDVLAVLKPYPIKLGQIANISEGGLAFFYLGSEHLTESYSSLDLFVRKDAREFPAFPIQILRDTLFTRIYENTIPIRLLAIRFQALTDEQHALIREFIANHTD